MARHILKSAAIATAVAASVGASASQHRGTQGSAPPQVNQTTLEAAKMMPQRRMAHLVVLKQQTPAILATQGVMGMVTTTSPLAIEQAHYQLTQRIKQLDKQAKVLGRTKILASSLIVEANNEALEKLLLDASVDKILPLFDYELQVADVNGYIKAGPVNAAGYTGTDQKVAVLDTGIDYTHAAFGGAGTAEAYIEAQQDPAAVSWPQGQVYGGYDYIRNDDDPIENDERFPGSDPGFTGHGTSVSHSVTGIAPGVELYVYSVCGENCPFEAQIAALESAMDPNGDGDISDRVDVINMSLGGEFGSTERLSGTQYLIHQAAKLGTNVVVSAGNDGDHPFRVGGPSTTPNALSVGAMTHPKAFDVEAEGRIAGVEAVVQAASFGSTESIEVTEQDYALVYPEGNSLGCALENGENPFANEDFTNQAVLLDRGVCLFTDKVLHAQQRGAELVMIANTLDDGSPTPMGGSNSAITIPSFGISLDSGNALKEQLQSGAASYYYKATFFSLASAVAGFSSRGPSMDGLLKPEITAPGIDIMVAATGTFNRLAPATGTSFSGPITAGAVALVRDARPELNAEEVKATLMNTADLNVTIDPLSTNPNSPLAPISVIGAGLVDVKKAIDTQAAAWVWQPVYDTNQAALSFGFQAIEKQTSLTKQVTVKNFSGVAKSYSLRIEARYQDDAQSGALSWQYPAQVNVAAGQTTTFDVTLTIEPSKLPAWDLVNPQETDDIERRSEALTLSEMDGALIFDDINTDTDHDMHLVYHILPKAAVVLEKQYKMVNGVVQVSLANKGTTSVGLVSDQLVAEGQAVSEEDKAFNILASSINVYEYELEACESNLLFTGSIKLRDRLTHLRQAGYQLNLDIDNDGVYDFALANINDVGRSAEVPGRSLTLSAPIIDGQPQWDPESTPASSLFHSSGSDTVTLTTCADAIGLTQEDLGEKTITVQAKVGESHFFIGIAAETDSLSGSATFATANARFLDIQGEEISDVLAPGDVAIIDANTPFAVMTNDLSELITPVTTEDFNKVPNTPVLSDSTLSVDENTANGTVIGQVSVVEQDFVSDITEFVLRAQSQESVTINTLGQVVVADSTLLDFEIGSNEIELVVIAVDDLGRMSNEATVTVMVTNVPDTEAELPKAPESSGSSGPLAWLSLLLAPLALLRRRKTR
ncbi:S8 family serine peptidase [Pseudoalteromonas sp. T1lg65]|uniref:S8 family serine peptidase n=1 Tax=Pseudoalteromonas sp. T1lg65 TaxID=2077101 RepID=UPI003F7AE6E0